MKKKMLTTFEKLEKSVGESFVEEMRSAQDDKVKNTIVSLVNDIESQQKLKKEDRKLLELNAQREALSDGYSDLIKGYKTKIKYLLKLLENRGKL
jgi:hypothetical protein